MNSFFKKSFLGLTLFIIVCPSIYGQSDIKNTPINTSSLAFSYSYQLPRGDMAKRFGNNSNVGINFMRKLNNNFVWSIDANYLFGNKLKEDNILDSLETVKGQLLNNQGAYSDIRLYERGINIYARAGKLFPVLNPNPNSGILVTFGVGFLQHKIRIETIDNNVPYLDSEYKKGYDRLTNGLSLHEFAGYLYTGSNRMINFYAGFEFTQAFTKNRRDYDFFLMKKDDNKRIDYLNGIRFGFMIPLYRRAPREFYFQ